IILLYPLSLHDALPIFYPLILTIATIGAYAVSASVVDLYLMLGFGLLGYLFDRFEIPVAPLLLAVVLGDMMEQSFRRALTISNGEVSVFVSSPICVVLLLMAAASVFGPILVNCAKRLRRTAPVLAPDGDTVK